MLVSCGIVDPCCCGSTVLIDEVRGGDVVSVCCCEMVLEGWVS